MKKQIRKTYICPETSITEYSIPIMDIDPSMPQGNVDDPIVDDEDDILSKGHRNHDDGNWGNLW